MKQPIIFKQEYQHIEENIKNFINNNKVGFLSERTISSPRAVGDAIQNLLEENFDKLLKGHIKKYSANFARRSMADLAFTDKEDFYHIVDIKTHRLDTVFNMPNLTSVERISKYYEDDKNYFNLLMVAYFTNDLRLDVHKVYFVPIEYLDWSCLTIGALGWGQIQISNSNNIVIKPKQTRRQWMITLCDTLMQFYPSEIMKIKERIDYFKQIKDFWLNKPE